MGARDARYQKTPKGKAAMKRYQQSAKGRARDGSPLRQGQGGADQCLGSLQGEGTGRTARTIVARAPDARELDRPAVAFGQRDSRLKRPTAKWAWFRRPTV